VNKRKSKDVKATARPEPIVKPLLAFCVWPGEPYDDGCMLTFERTRNKARAFVWRKGPWSEDYTTFHATRRIDYDYLAEGRTEAFMVETNAELPTGTEPFYDDER